MLEPDELMEVAAAFGVSETQVRRDHFISHVLVAIAQLGVSVTFFGGTALARTYLGNPSEGARLSEDIDLYARQRRDVTMRVPTMQGFAAMKVVAWMDRRTARDLYDLVGLARLGALDTTTAELVRHTSGLSVQPHFFTKAPSDWTGQLAHQTGRLIPAQEALRVVRMAFGETLDWEGDGVS